MIFNKFDSVTEIDKGWSGDKKYCAVKDGTKYLLRISPRNKFSKHYRIHKIMKQIDRKNISMCKPLKIGLCKEGTYILQSWIDGVDAEENIHNYSDEQQYEFGFQSGKILQKIHTVPAPKHQENWETRFNKKMNRKIQMYSDCLIKFDGAEYIIEYLLDCLEINEKDGIIYHRSGITGDYDDFDDAEELIDFIKKRKCNLYD